MFEFDNAAYLDDSPWFFNLHSEKESKNRFWERSEFCGKEVNFVLGWEV